MTALPLKADIGALAVTTHGRHTHARNAQPSPVAEFSHAPDFLGTKGRVLPGCCPVVAQHGGFARARKSCFKIRDLNVQAQNSDSRPSDY